MSMSGMTWTHMRDCNSLGLYTPHVGFVVQIMHEKLFAECEYRSANTKQPLCFSDPDPVKFSRLLHSEQTHQPITMVLLSRMSRPSPRTPTSTLSVWQTRSEWWKQWIIETTKQRQIRDSKVSLISWASYTDELLASVTEPPTFYPWLTPRKSIYS